MIMMRDPIEEFIAHFNKAKETFTSGCCYWFAFILAERFNGEIFYNPKENHFACGIQEDNLFPWIDGSAWVLYDINGNIKENVLDYILFKEYKKIDSTHYKRIVRDCIMMSGEDLND